MNVENTVDLVPVVKTGLSKVLQFDYDNHNEKIITDLREKCQRLELGLFRLVVMGEIKKGKSSFINALLGEEHLLPTDTDIATSTVYKILYGTEKKYKVFFSADIDTGLRRDSLEISEDQIQEYGTEGGNPNNEKNVDFIGIELPNSLLKTGLIIVDTPGVGGLYKAHRDITWKYAPNADAICFVLDSAECVISVDEIKFLRELTDKVTKKIFFIQTKIDSVDTEQWQGWEARNREVLLKELKVPEDGLIYFPLSSKNKFRADKKSSTKHLSRSGFRNVMQFLNQNLIKKKQAMMAQSLGTNLFNYVMDIEKSLSESIKITSISDRGELEALNRKLQEQRQLFKEWQTCTCRKELDKFDKLVQELSRKYRNRLQDELSSRELVTPLINRIDSSCSSAKEIEENLKEYQQDLIALVSERLTAIHQESNEESSKILIDTLNTLSSGLESVSQKSISGVDKTFMDGVAGSLETSLNMNNSTFSRLRSAFYGGSLGFTAASIVTTVFPPVALLGVFVVGLGAFQGYKENTGREKKEALQKVGSILRELHAELRTRAHRVIDEKDTAFRSMAKDALVDAQEKVMDGFNQKLTEVDNALKQGKAETRNRASELNKKIKYIQSVTGELKQVLT